MSIETVLFRDGFALKDISPMIARGILFSDPVKEYVVAVVVDKNLH